MELTTGIVFRWDSYLENYVDSNRKSILIATGIAIQIAVGLTMHDGHPGFFFSITGSGIFIRMVIGITMHMATWVVIAIVI